MKNMFNNVKRQLIGIYIKIINFQPKNYFQFFELKKSITMHYFYVNVIKYGMVRYSIEKSYSSATY